MLVCSNLVGCASTKQPIVPRATEYIIQYKALQPYSNPAKRPSLQEFGKGHLGASSNLYLDDIIAEKMEQYAIDLEDEVKYYRSQVEQNEI